LNTYIKNELANLISILKTNFNGYPWHGESAERTLLTKPTKFLLDRPKYFQKMVWKLTNEIIGWKKILIRTLQEGDLDFNQEVQRMSYHHPKDFNAELWKSLFHQYKSEHTELLKALEEFHRKPALSIKLVQQLNGKLLNVIMHEVYCMGQIEILLQTKKKHFEMD